MERIALDKDYYHDFFKISQGVKVSGPLIFLSGQVGMDHATGELVPGGMKGQCEQAFANIKRVLEAGGTSMAKVVEVTMFVTDMTVGLDVTNETREKYFTKEPFPACTLVEVKGLYCPEALVEIKAIALV